MKCDYVRASGAWSVASPSSVSMSSRAFGAAFPAAASRPASHAAWNSLRNFPDVAYNAGHCAANLIFVALSALNVVAS